MQISRGRRSVTRFAYAAIALALVTSLLYGAALLWPYNDVTYGKPGPLATTEYTSTGVPVIREGAPVTWKQPFCNRGQDTHNDRWADIYGPGGGLVRINPPEDSRVASFEIPSLVFYAPTKPTCGTAKVKIILPNYIAPDATYRLRIVGTYHPNPFRFVTVETVTDLFLLLPKRAPIP